MDSIENSQVAVLSDILRRRGIDQVVYFHADHFEPWGGRPVEDRWKSLRRFGEITARLKFGGKQTLFYTAFIVHGLLTPTRTGSHLPDDGVVFRELSPEFTANCRELLRPLETELGHEFQIHVHHEGWTRTALDLGEVSDWTRKHSSAAQDSERLRLFLDLTKRTMWEEIGRPFDSWYFVHGNWSLNASYPRTCQIEDEIQILMEKGCGGDFTFPAGNTACDPTILQGPYTCKPSAVAKCYDLAEGDLQLIGPGSRNLTPDRFFIWNSPIKAVNCSLDYFDAHILERIQATENFAKVWFEQSVVLAGVLYIKTHAHSLHHKSRIWEDGAPAPHNHPDVVKVFDLVQRACDHANIPITCETVHEVMRRMSLLDRGPGGADRKGLRSFEAPVGVAGEGTRDSSDAAPVGKSTPAPRSSSPVHGEGEPGQAGPVGREMLEFIKDALLKQMREHAAAADPFYRSRLDRGTVLEIYEQELLNYICAEWPAKDARIVEIGIGWDMLSICLAALGYSVTGYVGQASHAEVARHLVRGLAAFVPGLTAHCEIIEGFFPGGFDRPAKTPGRQNVIIATNVVHSFTARRQSEILGAMTQFDHVILYPGRFGVSRTGSELSSFGKVLSKSFVSEASLWGNNIFVLRPRERRPALVT